MKKFPLLITIPLIAIIAVVAGALMLKVMTPETQPVVQNPTEFPNNVGNTETAKPSTFLGGLFGQNKATSTPTPSPASAAQFTSELKDTYDDGDQAELDAIGKDAASL